MQALEQRLRNRDEQVDKLAAQLEDSNSRLRFREQEVRGHTEQGSATGAAEPSRRLIDCHAAAMCVHSCAATPFGFIAKWADTAVEPASRWVFSFACSIRLVGLIGSGGMDASYTTRLRERSRAVGQKKKDTFTGLSCAGRFDRRFFANQALSCRLGGASSQTRPELCSIFSSLCYIHNPLRCWTCGSALRASCSAPTPRAQQRRPQKPQQRRNPPPPRTTSTEHPPPGTNPRRPLLSREKS